MEDRFIIAGTQDDQYEVSLLWLEAACADRTQAKDALLRVTVVHVPSYTKVTDDDVPPQIISALAGLDIEIAPEYDIFDLRKKSKKSRAFARQVLTQFFSEPFAKIGRARENMVKWSLSFDEHRQQNSAVWTPCTLGLVTRPWTNNEYLNMEVWVLGLEIGEIRQMLQQHETCETFLRAMQGGCLSSVDLDPVRFFSVGCTADVVEAFKEFQDSGQDDDVFSNDFDTDGFWEELHSENRTWIECQKVRHRVGELRVVGTAKATSDYVEGPNILATLQEIAAGTYHCASE